MKYFNPVRYTKYVGFDAGRCTACGNCVENCPGKVIGKIKVSGQERTDIVYPDQCIGCMECWKGCASGSFAPILFSMLSIL